MGIVSTLLSKHGEYEIIYEVTAISWGIIKKKSGKTIVEADNPNDAENLAISLLKKNGYKDIKIIDIRLIKYTHAPITTASTEYGKTYNESRYNNTPTQNNPLLAIIITIILLGIIIGGIIFISSCQNCFKEKVDGKYYLSSITGTGEVSANSNDNYIVLDNGTCTLYFTLTRPAGSSVLTYKYTGNTYDDIHFEKSFIRMDNQHQVHIRLDYEDGHYNEFVYKKR